jgi:t-SNARE complex subunit (syntaxin)
MSNLTKFLENERAQRLEKQRLTEVAVNTRYSAAASRRPLALQPDQRLVPDPEEEEDKSRFAQQFGLDSNQLAMLVTENEGLLKEFQDTTVHVEQAAASLNEISRLQTTLQEQLMYQAAQVEHIYDDAQDVALTMAKANQQLNRATRRQSSSVGFFICFVLFATILLLILHFSSD